MNGQVLKLPEDAPASLGDAWVLLEAGDLKAAKTLFSSLVKGTSDPVKAQALFGLGKIAALDGKIIEATKNFIDSVRFNSANPECYLALGDIYIENGGQYMPALECYGQAVAYDPGSYENRQKFVNLVSALKFDKVNPNLAGIITLCLEHDDLYLYFFGAPWKSILIQDEAFLTVWKYAKYQDYSKFSEEFAKAGNYGGFIHPLFLYGLGKFLVNGRDFEHWIVNIRHYLLDLHKKGQYLFADSEENEYLYCALSRYAHHTDYIFSETPEEVDYIITLEEKINGQSVFDLKELALYACYRPIYVLKNTDKIFAWLGDDTEHVSYILKQHIRQYRDMAEIRKNIPALTPIDDEISRAVREQYEEFPYPRWSGVSNKLGEHRIESRLNDRAAKILVAGSGTGKEALEIALSFPKAEILAIDLSLSSISFAVMRARELGVKNITFKQADIFALGRVLKQDYDFITASGVLHHMNVPEDGLKALYDLLKPGGFMRIALYSSTARRAVNECRAVIEKMKIGGDKTSIQGFRDNIAKHISTESIQFLERFIDYSSLPMVRDLLFHVQEHQYDLPQVQALLKKFNLEFLGFHLKDSVLKDYRKFAKKDQDGTNLELWHKFEQKNPDTFMGMYTFWCEKT